MELNPLHLSGYGVKIKVRNLQTSSELEVTDGKEWIRGWGTTPQTHKFRPRRIPYSSIIVDGHSGYVTLQALHWLSRNGIPVFVLDRVDGSVVSNILPPAPIKADLRAAQIHASADWKRKFTIANCIVRAKVTRSLQVLDWLAQRHKIEREIELAKQETLQLRQACSVPELRTIEGRVALRYWQAFTSVMPRSLGFHGRMTSTRPSNASDPVNAALNYAYGVLEGECRRAINAVGLEPSVGFLHEFADYQTKQSLVYDLQEPFRWIADVTVVEAFESGTLSLQDFFFTGDDYRYRIETEPKRLLLDLLKERFNAGVKYGGHVMKWDTVIEQKAIELGRFLVGRSPRLDFSDPSPSLMTNERQLRSKVIGLASTEARRLGIGKSTLHYLRKRARDQKPFTIYEPVLAKLRD